MAGIRKAVNASNKLISFRFYSEHVNNTPLEFLKDLGQLFQNLAATFSQEEVNDFLYLHPLAKEIIEAIPE
jgi:hypothetical protein